MSADGSSPHPLRVLVWGENRHEQLQPHVAKLYPEGMHGTIAAGLRRVLGTEVEVRTVTLDDPEHGCTEENLAWADVVTWWGHKAHKEVDDAIVDRVQEAVLGGLGLVVLHSGHFSKIFKRLMGTTCSLRWRNDGKGERVWTIDSRHPIAQGVPNPIRIDAQEMYGEFFDIPTPDELVFISSFEGGEVFRSGCTFRRGHGRIFYFSPGDQEYPVYDHPDVQLVIANGVRWAHDPQRRREVPGLVKVEESSTW